MGNRLSLLQRLAAGARRPDAPDQESGGDTDDVACAKICDITAGENAVVRGRVRSVRFLPTENVPVLEAELSDGSDCVQLVWLGRRHIAGIEPGRKMLARGRLGEYNGRRAIYNPWYELK